MNAKPTLAKPVILALLAHGVVLLALAAIPLRSAVIRISTPDIQMTEPPTSTPAGNGGFGITAAILPPEPSPAMSPMTTMLPVICVFDPKADGENSNPRPAFAAGSLTDPGLGVGSGAGSDAGDASGSAGAGGSLSVVTNPKPSYPSIARQRGWEGTTLLLVEVLADGTVGTVEVRESSGHSVLDSTAVNAVRSWRFNLAEARATWVEIPIAYRLRLPAPPSDRG